MPSINMIAPRRAEKMRLERDMRRLVIVIMAELVFAVGLGGWVCTKLLTTSNRISELNDQLSRLQPVVKQIENYQSATRKLVPKMELLNKAKEQTMSWYNILDRLTQSFPQSTYLTRVSTSAAERGEAATKVNLTGISISQSKIGETMIRLQAIPDLENVELHFTQPASVRDAAALEFEIGAQVKGTEPRKGVKPDASSQS